LEVGRRSHQGASLVNRTVGDRGKKIIRCGREKKIVISLIRKLKKKHRLNGKKQMKGNKKALT